jgi:lipoate-protein ligase A
MNCIFIETPRLDVYTQMAFDELLAQELPQDSVFARFFNWADIPSATFGYAQFESSVRAQLAGLGIQEYTRRPTGGGIVPHKEDLTFSLCFRQEGNIRPADIYGTLHKAVKEEFIKAGLALAAYDKQSDYRPAAGGVSASCFANPVADDLLGPGGAKVLGGAIRRFGDCILYQGSLQLKNARGNETFKKALTEAFLKYFNAAPQKQTAGNALLAAAYDLAQKQYKSKGWIEKF